MTYRYFRLMGFISALSPWLVSYLICRFSQHPPSDGDLVGVMFLLVELVYWSFHVPFMNWGYIGDIYIYIYIILFFSGVSMGINNDPTDGGTLVPYFRPYFGGISPYIGLIYGRYVQWIGSWDGQWVCPCHMGLSSKMMDSLWWTNIAMENHHF